MDDYTRDRLERVCRVLRLSIGRGIGKKYSRSTMKADKKRLREIEAQIKTNEHDEINISTTGSAQQPSLPPQAERGNSKRFSFPAVA